MLFSKITISYFEDPYRTNDSQLAQEPREFWMDEKLSLAKEMQQLEFIRRPHSGRRRVNTPYVVRIFLYLFMYICIFVNIQPYFQP